MASSPSSYEPVALQIRRAIEYAALCAKFCEFYMIAHTPDTNRPTNTYLTKSLNECFDLSIRFFEHERTNPSLTPHEQGRLTKLLVVWNQQTFFYRDVRFGILQWLPEFSECETRRSFLRLWVTAETQI